MIISTPEKAPWEYTPMRHCEPIPIPKHQQRYHKLCKMHELALQTQVYDVLYLIEKELKDERKRAYK